MFALQDGNQSASNRRSLLTTAMMLAFGATAVVWSSQYATAGTRGISNAEREQAGTVTDFEYQEYEARDLAAKASKNAKKAKSNSKAPKVKSTKKPKSSSTKAPKSTKSTKSTKKSQTSNPTGQPTAPILIADVEVSKALGAGDVHYHTFDGVQFECHAHGELVLLKSLNSELEIQARSSPVGDGLPTITTAIAVRDVGGPTVQLSIASSSDQGTSVGGCPVLFFVDGIETDLLEGTGVDACDVFVSDDTITIKYTETGLQVDVEVGEWPTDCWLNAAYDLNEELRTGETLVGLLGSPNGESSDDWMTSDGSTLAMPSDPANAFEEAHEYCSQQWCLRDSSSSLFSYETNQTFADFQDCDFPYDSSIETAVENASDEIVSICGNDPACLVDGVTLGVEAANAYNDFISKYLGITIGTPEPTGVPSASPTVTIGTPAPTGAPSASPSAAPTGCSPEFILTYLESLSDATELSTDGTPQNLAYNWVLDDELCPPAEGFDQRYIAAVLGYSLVGSGSSFPSTWFDHSAHECDWYGIDCEDGTIDVIAITDAITIIEGVRFQGTMPTEIGHLKEITSFRIASHRVKGTIPTELGELTKIELLSIFENKLTGTIPTEIANLRDCVYALLYSNKLSGTIPSGIGQLSALLYLFLYDNSLTGTIPLQTFDLDEATYLHLAENELTGTIPSQVGLMTNLVFLSLSNNNLSGNIPSELGNLASLDTLQLQLNKLSGAFPTEMASLAALSTMKIESNALSGTVPDELCAHADSFSADCADSASANYVECSCCDCS
eukprot:Nitzschia sp. Nitz4//scaffold98_size77359//56502//58924//NITZ4_005554-RA/size77359-augustus-gene-0.60-mRNA-1//-1//CDS//3329560775//2628//frame0